MKIKIIVLSIILFFLVLFIFLLTSQKKEGTPKIILKGNKIITINIGEKYKDSGFKAIDSIDGDITSKVNVSSNINYKSPGTYEIVYEVKNSSGIKTVNHRFIKITEKPYYKDNYDNIDNTSRGWWATNKKDGTRPSGGANINELKKYNAYYMGPNEKIIYLTFDEGSLDTYVKEIVDVLDKNNIKATFFLCYKFMEENKDLIKKMADNGHLIANHTVNHKNMPSLATRENFNEYLYEIQKVEDIYYNITGRKMDKVYRDPKGEWSFRDLQIMKDLGYKSYFYSAYYMDFGDNVSKEYALNELTKRYHNGAIYLLHPKNKGNLEALEPFINEMQNKGYKFDLVKNIP